MTAVLLDTHVLLWLLTDDPSLGTDARARLAATGDRLASAASMWEIAIKADLGKLTVPDDLPARIEATGLVWLDVRPEHTWGIRGVTGLAHRDPFDRLLLAQAQLEGVSFLTADTAVLAAELGTTVDRVDARR